MKKTIMAGALALAFSAAALADDRLVRFEGGIGVIPVSSTLGNASVADAVRNDVRKSHPAASRGRFQD